MTQEATTMNSYSRVYAAIDLDAVESNMRAMKDSLPPSTSMIGVVKTDGYGPVSYTHLWRDLPRMP